MRTHIALSLGFVLVTLISCQRVNPNYPRSLVSTTFKEADFGKLPTFPKNEKALNFVPLIDTKGIPLEGHTTKETTFSKIDDKGVLQECKLPKGTRLFIVAQRSFKSGEYFIAQLEKPCITSNQANLLEAYVAFDDVEVKKVETIAFEPSAEFLPPVTSSSASQTTEPSKPEETGKTTTESAVPNSSAAPVVPATPEPTPVPTPVPTTVPTPVPTPVPHPVAQPQPQPQPQPVAEPQPPAPQPPVQQANAEPVTQPPQQNRSPFCEKFILVNKDYALPPLSQLFKNAQQQQQRGLSKVGSSLHFIPGALVRKAHHNLKFVFKGYADHFDFYGVGHAERGEVRNSIAASSYYQQQDDVYIIPFKDAIGQNSWFNEEVHITVTPKNNTGAKGQSCTLTIRLASPLVLDFTASSMPVFSDFASAPVSFDLDGDGKKEQTGWLALSTQALLALDLNGNRKIDSGKELLGEYTGSTNGSATFADGYEALASFDENKDGFIDKHDAIYSKLLLWFDTNRNGITEASELKTLTEKQVTRISVKKEKMPEATQQDLTQNDIRYRSVFFGPKFCPRKGCTSYDVFFRSAQSE